MFRAQIRYVTESNEVWHRRNSVGVKALEVHSVGEDFGIPWWLENMYGTRLPRYPGKTPDGKERRKPRGWWSKLGWGLPRSREEFVLYNGPRGWWFKRGWGVAGVPLGSLKEGEEYWLAIDSPGSVRSSILHAEPAK